MNRTIKHKKTNTIKHKFKHNVYLVVDNHNNEIIIKFVEPNDSEIYFYNILRSNYVVNMIDNYEISYQDAVKVTNNGIRFENTKTLIVIELENMKGTIDTLLGMNSFQKGYNLYELYLKTHLGLDSIHSKGVAHNDVSVGNIMYSELEGILTYKYIDFEYSCGENIKCDSDVKKSQNMDVWDLNSSIYDFFTTEDIDDLSDMEEINENINKYKSPYNDVYTNKVINAMKYVFRGNGNITASQVIEYLLMV